MQGKLKKIIMILIVLVLILSAIMVILINKLSKPEPSKEDIEAVQSEREQFEKMQEDPSIIINGEKLEEVKSEGIYLTVARAIKKYEYYLAQQNAEATYNLIYGEYIVQNDINQENILQKLEKHENYEIEQMLSLVTINYGIYYVKINYNETERFLIINWDTENDTFSVCPITQEEYNIGMQQGISVNKERISTIEKNEYNKVISEKVENDTIAEKYFYDYIELVVNNPERAYELLDSEYKEVSLKTYNEFLEYVTNNKERLTSLDHNNFKTSDEFEDYEEYEKYYQQVHRNKITNYVQETVDGIKIYTYLDSYGKYYIFKVSAAMKYTVFMDNYTIATSDYIETYNQSTEPEKVVLNIKKFFMGIDDKNYGYSYNLLSEAFRNNKYQTQNDFVNYAKQNFFEENEIQYMSYEKENGVYIYKIKITDSTGKSTEERKFNIILKLRSGTDFEMSFSEN